MNYKLLFVFILLFDTVSIVAQKIDRFALVRRHNITTTSIDSLNSLTVGNGRFAFTVDITGLQTFPEYYEKGIPLGTMADWAWHSFTNPQNYCPTDVTKYYQVGNDSVPYYFQFTDDQDSRKNKATQWLRENPHRFHLGIIGLELLQSDSTEIKIEDIQNPVQHLNLWTGEIISQFKIEGKTVKVITLCDQNNDKISLHIESELIRTGKLHVNLKFPYARHEKFNPGYDFESPEKHSSEVVELKPGNCTIKRQLDGTVYYSRIDWGNSTKLKRKGSHAISIEPDINKSSFNLSILFSDSLPKGQLLGFSETRKQNQNHWKHFWQSGGAVDFSECTDPRAFELERRVILSQYLTKIQCSGKYPPQETGLTYNSWYGKFHLEMHWWHAIHFILWNRPDLVEKQLDYYASIFEKAKQTANFQGYKGVRWPKMTDPEGCESPSIVGTFLIWQQPHFIYFADLLYKYNNEEKKILKKYNKLVFATADFMASYARYDSARNEYVLGPALIPAQERFAPETTINPSFELAYWHWGLKTAQIWKERLGLSRDTLWQKVLDKLSPMPVKDSLYLFTETTPDSYTNEQFLTDHPMVLGILGFIPETSKIDKKILFKTLETVLKKWKWETCWGWDFPLAAMSATALDQPDLAIDLLLMDTPKNTYLLNGHNYQDENLTIYLPGNGSLLTAIAMMSTYKNKKDKKGFPQNGKWKVKFEKIHKLY
jgi:hypothetical protein